MKIKATAGNIITVANPPLILINADNNDAGNNENNPKDFYQPPDATLTSWVFPKIQIWGFQM